MRPLATQAPQFIDPWNFAQGRKMLCVTLPLCDTQEVKQWVKKDDVVSFHIKGMIDEYRQPHLMGSFALTLTLQCQRCLNAMQWPLEHEFDYVLIRDETQEDKVEGNSETLICTENTMDLVWFLEEEILLAMPMIAKHDNCLPPAHVNEKLPSSEHPFAALKEMMKSKEQP